MGEATSELPSHPGARNVVVESVATAILMLAGPGVIVLSDGRVSNLTAAVAFGAAIALAIGVIGAVANPAVTFALLVAREVTGREAIGDWVGQLVGAVAGGAMIWGIDELDRSPLGANGWDRNGFDGIGSVIAAELVFTVVVVVVLLSAISQGLSRSAIAAFTGLAYGVACLVLLPISGAGLNPARSIGAAIFADTDPNALGQVWVFVLVPLVGAFAAVFIWLAIDDATVDDTILDDTVLDDLADALDGTPD